jgi:hypothetical protein
MFFLGKESKPFPDFCPLPESPAPNVEKESVSRKDIEVMLDGLEKREEWHQVIHVIEWLKAHGVEVKERT